MRLEDYRPFEATLPNGLRVASLGLAHVHRVAIAAVIRVGSRFETPDNNGLSHFLEHMLYRGTPTHPSAGALSNAFESLGGSLNATTATDVGTLTVTVPPENFETLAPLFAEVFREPVFDAMDVERGIVREELLDELDEEGRLIDADTLLKMLVFPDHPLGLPLGGTIAHLDRFDVPSLREHHGRHYNAGATCLTVVGPVDPERAVDSIARHFAPIASGSIPPSAPPAEQRRSEFRFVRHASSQTTIRVGFRAPGIRNSLEPATDLLLRVIDDGMSTRLYRHICEDRGLCYDVGASYEAYEDSGLVTLGAETAHERAETVLTELFAIARDLRDHGPTEVEIDKAKARHRWQLFESLDAADELAEYLAEQRLANAAKTLAERGDQIAAVTRAEVRDAAERLFAPSSRSTIVVGMQPKRARERLEKLARSA